MTGLVNKPCPGEIENLITKGGPFILDYFTCKDCRFQIKTS